MKIKFTQLLTRTRVEERLWCWSFWDKEDGQYIIPLPILEIATYSGSPHIETYYKGGSPDVAYLILDINHRINRLKTNEYVSLAVAKKVLREIGTGVAMIGYPSPNMLMTYDKEGTPRCMEPLVQYFHLSGVLPALKAHLPHYLAFDSVFAKGSSGSPIVDLSTGEVVAIGAQLHPFYMPTFLSEEEYILTVVPSSIGFGVPSCFFYELSVSKTGIGKFEWDNFV